jgi:hypothetical protein
MHRYHLGVEQRVDEAAGEGRQRGAQVRVVDLGRLVEAVSRKP